MLGQLAARAGAGQQLGRPAAGLSGHQSSGPAGADPGKQLNCCDNIFKGAFS